MFVLLWFKPPLSKPRSQEPGEQRVLEAAASVASVWSGGPLVSAPFSEARRASQKA